MKILMVAAEAAPYAQIGGLSQVVTHLAHALRQHGEDVRIFLPKYGGIENQEKVSLAYQTRDLRIVVGAPEAGSAPRHLICHIKEATDRTGLPAYFLENREYFELRSNIYGYRDDHIRFALLSLGCLEWLLRQQQHKLWLPDIIHCHDWHTGYLVEYLRQLPRYRSTLGTIKIVYTIHNLAHQASINLRHIPPADHDTGKTPLVSMFDSTFSRHNPLLRGVQGADIVTTVSESYAKEITTPEFGEGLDSSLGLLRDRLVGILNGLDDTLFNPATDRSIVARFSLHRFSQRSRNKPALQTLFQLPRRSVPILAYVGRLASQKGIDTLVEAAAHLLDEYDVQLIIVGSGDDALHRQIEVLNKRYPKKVGVHLFRNFTLPRQIYAGADLVVIPSKFEPAGIVPLEAMRYGCIPIVSKTGGLQESVTEFNPTTKQGNGFVFRVGDPWSLYGAMVRSLGFYEDQQHWRTLMRNAMRHDSSWKRPAAAYQALYHRLQGTVLGDVGNIIREQV